MSAASLARTSFRASPKPELREVPVDEVLVEDDNIRSFRIDDEHGRGLRDSIREVGILQPLLLAPLPKARASGERYVLVAGFRRFSAACEAGKSSVPARVVPMSRPEILLARITENVQRLGATPLEEGRAVAEYIRLTKCTQLEVAHRLGKSQSWVSTRCALTAFPADVLAMIERREISLGQITQMMLLPSDDIEGIRELARAAKDGLTPPALEQLARRRMYKLAGGSGPGPSWKPCGPTCACTCRCCRNKKEVK